MPGNLAAAVVEAGTVFPLNSYTSFSYDVTFPMLAQRYHDATTERSLIVDGVNPAVPMRSWHLSLRLTTEKLLALQTFFEETVEGGKKRFYFYPDPADHDGSGVSTIGRVICRFRGGWANSVDIGRSAVGSIDIVECA